MGYFSPLTLKLFHCFTETYENTIGSNQEKMSKAMTQCYNIIRHNTMLEWDFFLQDTYCNKDINFT